MVRTCLRWSVIVGIFLSGATRAHELKSLFLEIEREEATGWRGVIHFDAGYALPEMRADRDAPQPTRDWLTGQSEEDWHRLRGGAEAYLRESLLFRASQEDPSLLSWSVHYPDFTFSPPDFPRLPDGGAYFRVVLRGQTPSGSLLLHVGEGPRPSIIVSIKGDEHPFVVLPGKSAILMAPNAPSQTSDASPADELTRLYGFGELGFSHVIPHGWDHILFILALFFLSARWKPLLAQSLTFTLAHSLTLALAIGGNLSISPRIIEPLIALSIAWVAIQNLFTTQPGKQRLLLVFLFGLIHGLGFAGALAGNIPSQNAWLLPLLATNIGVEIAQVTLLAGALLLLGWAKDETWYPRLRQTASAVIALCGAWWFIERLVSLQT